MPSNRQRTLDLARTHGILRAVDARAHGIDSKTLTRLVRDGELVRVGRGLYEIRGAEIGEHHTLAEVARRVPGAVICLLSALSFHGLTTQLPGPVWLAHRRGSWAPTGLDVATQIIKVSGDVFDHGVQTHDVDGVPVKVTSPARTVADCFRFRSRVGLDVAMEALRSYVEHGAGTVDELWEAARVCRVGTVIRPYLDMVLPPRLGASSCAVCSVTTSAPCGGSRETAGGTQGTDVVRSCVAPSASPG